MKFRVIDNKTGKEADTWNIAQHEEWAQGLVYCDMEGFAITEDGTLVLMDECGHVVYCDAERFKVVFEDERPHGEWIRDNEFLKFTGDFKCSNCNIISGLPFPYCPNCGANMNKKIKNTQDEYAKMRAREF